jgi:hypothetical protein
MAATPWRHSHPFGRMSNVGLLMPTWLYHSFFWPGADGLVAAQTQ